MAGVKKPFSMSDWVVIMMPDIVATVLPDIYILNCLYLRCSGARMLARELAATVRKGSSQKLVLIRLVRLPAES